jgi:hypothetical protein
MFGENVTEPMAGPLNHPIGRRFVLTLASIGLFLGVIACGTEVAPPNVGDAATPIPATATPEPYLKLPDGWTRTQVRAGFLGRYTNNPLVGFTIDLPPGWIVGESWPWPVEGVINGWIAAPPRIPSAGWPRLFYQIGYKSEQEVAALEEGPGYEITELEVLGAKVTVRLPTIDPQENRARYDAHYERIPGAPEGVVAPRLDITGSRNSYGFDDMDLLGHVLRSVRYAALPSLPDTPIPDAIAFDDWVRKVAGSDGEIADVYLGGSFSLRLPPGWTTVERNGVDGVIGEIAGDGIELTYYNPMGLSAGRPPSPTGVSQQTPPHVAWEERVDDLVISLVRPMSAVPDRLATTGVTFWPFVDGGASFPFSNSTQMSVSGKGLDGDQQETVLAIFRTIQLVRND